MVVDKDVAGNPQTEQRWTCQSLSKIQTTLEEQSGALLSRETIRGLLNNQKIRPKSNVKRLHPKRDQQFAYLKGQRAAFARAGWPCISVDTKKKELVGNFFNRGRQWCREATAVNTHDFPSYATGKAVPYGLYDVTQNLGYVALGQSADTSELAVDALVWWWSQFGRDFYPTAPELMILADAGGSNGCRSRLWKQQLQVKLADAFGLSVTVCHYPTGASKWNPIEHRLFSQVSGTWAATPLTSYDVVLEGLRSTTTVTGLRVEATLFDTLYQKGLRVIDEEKVPGDRRKSLCGAAGMASLLIKKHAVCLQWNYTIRPRKSGGNF